MVQKKEHRKSYGLENVKKFDKKDLIDKLNRSNSFVRKKGMFRA